MAVRVPKKKVLIFSTAFHPFVGGAEVAIKEITKRLDKSYEFDIITAMLDRNLPSFEKIDNINVFRIGNGKRPLLDKMLLPLRGAYFAYKLNKERQYSFFWGMMITFGSGAAFLCNVLNRILRKPAIPVVLTLQEGDSESHLTYRWGGLIFIAWKLALRKTDKLTAISNFLLDRAKRIGFNGQSFLVPNGVDIKLFSQKVGVETQNKIKSELDKNPADIFLITVGRLTYKNATDDLISSLSRLPQNIKLLVIGRGEDRHKLEKLTKDLSLENRVKFLGYMDYSDIPKYLAVSDIFIRPSRSEGFGNSFIEAMAARIPVIATPVGGIADFLDDRETGMFCAPNSPKSIANTVMALIQDKPLSNRIVEKAFNRVKDKYTWDCIALEMKRVFDSV